MNKKNYLISFILFSLLISLLALVIIVNFQLNNDKNKTNLKNEVSNFQKENGVVSEFNENSFCQGLPPVKFNDENLLFLDEFSLPIEDFQRIVSNPTCRTYDVAYIQKDNEQTCLRNINISVWPYNTEYSLEMNTLVAFDNSYELTDKIKLDFEGISQISLDNFLHRARYIDPIANFEKLPFTISSIGTTGIGQESVYIKINDKFGLLLLIDFYVPEGCEYNCGCSGDLDKLIQDFFDDINLASNLSEYKTLDNYANVRSFLNKFYFGINNCKFEKSCRESYELSTKSLDYNEFKSLYIDVDDVRYIPRTLEYIEGNIYSYEVIIYESDNLSRYSVVAELEIDPSGNVIQFKNIISSVKI